MPRPLFLPIESESSPRRNLQAFQFSIFISHLSSLIFPLSFFLLKNLSQFLTFFALYLCGANYPFKNNTYEKNTNTQFDKKRHYNFSRHSQQWCRRMPQSTILPRCQTPHSYSTPHNYCRGELQAFSSSSTQ